MKKNRICFVFLSLIFCSTSSSLYAVDLLFLGGKDLSDFSIDVQTPEEIDFNQTSSANCIALRVAEETSDFLRVGIECCVSLSDFEWKAESDSVARSERVDLGHLQLYANVHYDGIFLNPFARLGVGVHWGRLVRSYQRGDLVWKDADGMKRVPGLTIGGGFSIPINTLLFCQIEADYNFVKRDTFQGWQVEDVDNMNNWQLLLGIGMRL